MQTDIGERLYINDVSARDGLQMEPVFVPTEKKVEYVNRLARTGLAKIEVTSFTAPKLVPTLADAENVVQGLARVPGVIYTALVPNLRGCERALATPIDEVNLVMSASESHNRANLRMTCEQSLSQLSDIARHALGRVGVSASLSTALGCPFEGEIGPSRVFDIVDRLVAMGIGQITLCDTTGMANPNQVAGLFAGAITRWPQVEFTAHFHNTRGMGLANALAALQAGVRRFDASLGGLGGCPFAPGATGNVCTEDLVHMFQAMGCNTGVDLEALLRVASDVAALVGHEVPGQVVKAGPSTKRHPLPSSMASADTNGRCMG